MFSNGFLLKTFFFLHQNPLPSSPSLSYFLPPTSVFVPGTNQWKSVNRANLWRHKSSRWLWMFGKIVHASWGKAVYKCRSGIVRVRGGPNWLIWKLVHRLPLFISWGDCMKMCVSWMPDRLLGKANLFHSGAVALMHSRSEQGLGLLPRAPKLDTVLPRICSDFCEQDVFCKCLVTAAYLKHFCDE